MGDVPTFAQAGSDWLKGLPSDIRANGRPLAARTRLAYSGSFQRATEILGKLPLKAINNEVLRDLIAKMRSNYSAATIRGDLAVIKLVVESITSDGSPMYPLHIKKTFCRVPDLTRPEENPRCPCASREDIERALTEPEIAGHIAIAAGLGLRVSEILALRIGECPGLDCIDFDGAYVHVRATCKTPSARRSIPIPRSLNGFLFQYAANRSAGELLFTVPQNRLYNLLEKFKLPPMHSYRRFFASVKDEAGMNPSALKRIMGHSKGGDITLRYSRAAENAQFLRDEMNRCPLGFTLPAFVAPEIAEAVSA